MFTVPTVNHKHSVHDICERENDRCDHVDNDFENLSHFECMILLTVWEAECRYLLVWCVKTMNEIKTFR